MDLLLNISESSSDDDRQSTISDHMNLMDLFDHEELARFRFSPVFSDIGDEIISNFDREVSISDNPEELHSRTIGRSLDTKTFSPFESLPSELIQQIASHVGSDEDLVNLSLASPIIAGYLVADDSEVWRKRFLSLYDYPNINGPHEFVIAYKIRRLVLRKFEDFGSITEDRARVQLDVIKDMVLEAYNPPKPHLPSPAHSKNLAAIASTETSPWTIALASSVLYRNKRAKYGCPNPLFDTLQVVLSHLVLSRKSALAYYAFTRRDDYNLTRVYHFNEPLQALLKCIPNEPKGQKVRSLRFPDLQRSSTLASGVHFELDIHTLLHIRNFWQRHLIDSTETVSEHTYSSMAVALAKHGKVPQQWEHPLGSQIPINTEWYGHYSCLHPWPKSRKDIEEQQTCAEDWDRIDPMVLNFETSSKNKESSFWPPIFSSIPLFNEIIPQERFAKIFNTTYIRGSAPFLLLGDTDSTSKSVEWHPFKSSRLHGVIHDISAEVSFGSTAAQEQALVDGETPIPGWKHIVMILYKPSSRALLSILEHAEEDYGGTANTDFNTADIWNNATTGEAPNGVNEVASTNEANMEMTPDTDTTTITTATTDSTDSGSQDSSEAQVEAHFQKLLAARITSFTDTYTERLTAESKQEEHVEVENPYTPSYNKMKKTKKIETLPPIWSAAHIRQLDDAYSQVQYLTWDDGHIDYAYAYEGIIIPGGKIMMGRFWRIHGVEGMGPGKEVGADGVGAELRPVEQPSNSPNTTDSNSDVDDSDYEDRGEYRGKSPFHSRKTKRRGAARVARDEGEEGEGDSSKDESEDRNARRRDQAKSKRKEPEYEVVTMVDGEETRASDAHKGLDRGPFIFWAG